jgi:spore maturation protein CgeB
MKLCIIDPAHHLPGLIRLFPEADYYAHLPDTFFNYYWTNHMPPAEFEKYYQFQYRTDWNSITSENYDCVFIVFPLYDAYGKKPFQHDIASAMIERIYTLLRSQSFLHVSLFDVHDYPYDPSLYKDQPVNTFFKRNYSLKHSYSSNVFPFPLSMFLRPCVLWNMIDHIEKTSSIDSSLKIMDAIWIGGTYTHTDHNESIVRDREGIHREIQPYIISHRHLPYHEYLNTMKKYAIAIDLVGVGDPNKRTFEILSSSSLLMTNITELNWGFDMGDSFSDLCVFSNGDDFLRKKTVLLENKEMYDEALTTQIHLVRKYFNKDRLRSYITKKIPMY